MSEVTGETKANLPTEVRMFKVSELIVDPDAQVRVDILANAQEIAASIKENSLQYLPKVFLDAEGKPHVFQGMSRFIACRDILRMTEIECEIVQTEPKNAIMLTMTENLKRANYSSLEQGRIFQAAIGRGWTVKQIAQKQDLAPKHIEQCLDVTKLPDKGQLLVHEGHLGLEAAARLAETPDAVQEQLCKEWSQERKRVRLENAIFEINRTVKDYDDTLKLEESLKEAKHPKCPTCKKRASSLSDRKEGFVSCERFSSYDDKHNWNPKTGETLAEVYAKQHPQDYRRTADGKVEKARIIVRAFRSPIPLEILNRAMMTYAVEQGHKLLREKPGGNISIQVGGKHIQIETGSDTLRYSTWNWGSDDHGLVIEKKHYGDRAGNVTKIIPNYFGDKQSEADRAKRQAQRFLDGLDEVAKFRQKMKTQKPLETKPRKRKLQVK